VTTADGAVVLRVHAQPGASRTGTAGVHGDALKVRVREPADKGRANRAIEAVVADMFGVAPSAVTITSGASGRAKRVRVEGVMPEEAVEKLRAALGDTDTHP